MVIIPAAYSADPSPELDCPDLYFYGFAHSFQENAGKLLQTSLDHFPPRHIKFISISLDATKSEVLTAS